MKDKWRTSANTLAQRFIQSAALTARLTTTTLRCYACLVPPVTLSDTVPKHWPGESSLLLLKNAPHPLKQRLRAPKTLPPAPASSLHFPLSNSHILSRSSLTPRLLPFPSLSSPFLNVCLPAFLNLNLDLNSHLACSSTHTPLDKFTHHLHSPDHRPTRASLFYEILPTKVTVVSYTRSNHSFGPY